MTGSHARFLILAGVASILTAVSTLMLIFLPDLYAPVADGLQGRMERVADPVYRLRSWVALVHPLLAFTAAAGVAIVLRPRAPILAAVGALAFGAWAFTEVAQQAMTLFAFDPWRQAWLAGDPATLASIEVRAAVYDGLWEAAYNLILLFFLIGCLSYGWALFGERTALPRTVGMFYGLAALLTITLMLIQLGGPDLLGSASKWAYAATQPLARLLIGVWLLRSARQPAG